MNASAELEFTPKIKASIKSAINEEYENSLRISSGDKQIFVKEPWHCSQFQGQKAKIKILEDNQEKTIEVTDEVGLFTREIDEASSCIKAGKIESSFMPHADSLSNSIWLDKWLFCLLYTSPSPRDKRQSRMPSSA